MPNVAIYNISGAKVGEMELSENIFGPGAQRSRNARLRQGLSCKSASGHSER